MLLVAMAMQAQTTTTVQPKIKIGGNVYGGGNAGDMTGSTSVTVYAGDLKDVYGGARMADVGGRTFVNIDGAHSSDDILIMNVYGGNDISGKIGESETATTVPTELTEVGTTAGKSNINNTWKAFIRTSPCTTKETVTVGTGTDATEVTAEKNLVVIGGLFGGGNGDYTYGSRTTGEGAEAVTTYFAKKGTEVVATSTKEELKAPELSKTYLEVTGGNIAHVYGGGNNATVTQATTICIDNASDDLQKVATVRAGKTDSQ